MTRGQSGHYAKARTIVIILTGVSPMLVACANELGPQKLGGPLTHAQRTAPSAGALPADNEPLRRGAHSDRVLSAIALERVTGRQPAASRLLPQN